MMKTNVMTVDASLLVVMNNSYFGHLLADCFAFSRPSFNTYATTHQSLASFLSPCSLA
jgi:hypothetical protein